MTSSQDHSTRRMADRPIVVLVVLTEALGEGHKLIQVFDLPGFFRPVFVNAHLFADRLLRHVISRKGCEVPGEQLPASGWHNSYRPCARSAWHRVGLVLGPWGNSMGPLRSMSYRQSSPRLTSHNPY